MINSQWLPQAEGAFQEREGDKVPFDTQPVAIEGDELIKPVSEASVDQLLWRSQ